MYIFFQVYFKKVLEYNLQHCNIVKKLGISIVLRVILAVQFFKHERRINYGNTIHFKLQSTQAIQL
jgi:hypothetical protein